RAITRRPDVFLFDEPLSNLDAELRVKMRLEFARLHDELKTTMIYVTHDQVEAMTLADKIVVLSAGRIEQVGSPAELYHAPVNRFVAGFIGSPKMNFFSGEITAIDADGLRVRLASGAVQHAAVATDGARVGAPVTLGVRPEHLCLIEPGAAIDPATLIQARASLVESLGDVAYLYGDADDAMDGIIVRVPPLAVLPRKTAVSLRAAPRHLHVFAEDGRAYVRRQPVDQQAA
ncbi:MAG: ABC transporter ATP-binding protein, partial [Janthinobacterium lividum]